MSSSLYITSTRARAGKTVVALGVAELLAREVGRVAVFRPVVPDPTPTRPADPLVDLLIDRFGLRSNRLVLGWREVDLSDPERPVLRGHATVRPAASRR